MIASGNVFTLWLCPIMKPFIFWFGPITSPIYLYLNKGPTAYKFSDVPSVLRETNPTILLRVNHRIHQKEQLSSIDTCTRIA